MDSERILQARKGLQMSRATLAFEVRSRAEPEWDIRTNEQAIKRWESGKHQPHPLVVPLLADALGVSRRWLTGEVDTEQEDVLLEDWNEIGARLLERGRWAEPRADSSGPTPERGSAERLLPTDGRKR